MKYNAEFISTTSDDASKSIQNYFSAREPELRERYHIVESRLPLLEFPEKIFGFSPETLIIFLSRHSSKAKVNSITVHPVGNFSSNDVGGVQRDIAISCPEIQSSVLRKMNETYHGDRYQITFEATHHGPQSNNHKSFAFRSFSYGHLNFFLANFIHSKFRYYVTYINFIFNCIR